MYASGLVSINLPNAKFEVPAFTRSKDMIVVPKFGQLVKNSDEKPHRHLVTPHMTLMNGWVRT